MIGLGRWRRTDLVDWPLCVRLWVMSDCVECSSTESARCHRNKMAPRRMICVYNCSTDLGTYSLLSVYMSFFLFLTVCLGVCFSVCLHVCLCVCFCDSLKSTNRSGVEWLRRHLESSDISVHSLIFKGLQNCHADATFMPLSEYWLVSLSDWIICSYSNYL